MKHCQDLLPAPARYLLLVSERAAARLRGDSGDVSVMGTIIIAAGLAAAAGLIVVTITGKMQAFLAQIP